ncbi:MAG: fibronectin type III domain-containing protein [Nitrospira sp.]|nr:MAG: fibronectin type III domain-containing protein [Nitrospira sp.]
MGLTKSMTRRYHVLQICTFLLATTGCASSTPTSTNGTATLSWDASERADLAGHKIYQATAPGAYGDPIATVPMNVTSYTVPGLASGTTYFFTVTAYNTDGAESSFSNEVSKTIP